MITSNALLNMRDNNKRKREEEPYYMQNANEVHTYQEVVSEATTSNVQNPVIEHNPSFNQSLLLNQPVVQNQQMLYQLQRASDQQQNLVYLLVPANENIQLQSVPLSVLPNEHVASSPQYIVNTQLNNQNRERIDSILPHDEVKQELSTVKAEYYQENNFSVKHTKNVNYSYNHQASKVKPDVYVNAPSYSDFPKQINTNTVLKEQVNTSKPHLYRCDYKDCSDSFYSLYEKKLHLDTHFFPENNEFKCSICNMVFEKAIDRNKHVESHSVAPTFKCRNCQRDFAYYTVLLKHVEEKKCSTKTMMCCYFCEMKFFDTEDFTRHHQLAMKLCACGTKICGNQAYELHLSICAAFKSSDIKTVDRKKIKTKKV